MYMIFLHSCTIVEIKKNFISMIHYAYLCNEIMDSWDKHNFKWMKFDAHEYRNNEEIRHDGKGGRKFFDWQFLKKERERGKYGKSYMQFHWWKEFISYTRKMPTKITKYGINKYL